MKTAILYLRAHKTTLYSQALALDQYCEEKNIKILKAFYEFEGATPSEQPERTEMIQAIFSHNLKPDFLLFTSLEIFSEGISDALNLHSILTMFKVTPRAILQPNVLFLSMPKN